MDFVDVYFNLHRKVWSLKGRAQGRILAHARRLAFDNPTQFIVHPAGRERVLRERHKNVHAFVRGVPRILDDLESDPSLEGMVAVGYNPYAAGHFVRRDDASPIRTAQRVVMLAPDNAPPQVWALLLSPSPS